MVVNDEQKIQHTLLMEKKIIWIMFPTIVPKTIKPTVLTPTTTSNNTKTRKYFPHKLESIWETTTTTTTTGWDWDVLQTAIHGQSKDIEKIKSLFVHKQNTVNIRLDL